MPLAETRSFASAAASVGATSDSDVSAPANVDGSSSAEADATESEAIQEEIARFERRFGPASEVKTRAISGAA